MKVLARSGGDGLSWWHLPGGGHTAVEKSEEEPRKSEEQLSYKERVRKLIEEKPVPLDPEALKTDLFESDEELDAFIEDIYRYRRSFTA